MNDNSFYVCGMIVLIAWLCTAMGALHGCEAGRNDLRRQAIQAGVAEYRCDPRTGASEFRFLTVTEQRKDGE